MRFANRVQTKREGITSELIDHLRWSTTFDVEHVSDMLDTIASSLDLAWMKARWATVIRIDFTQVSHSLFRSRDRN